MSKAKDLAAEVNKFLGTDAVQMGGDARFKVDYLPTGIMPIDDLLQGGFPRGRTIEIFGDYSTLKSYIALCAIARTQEAGGTCALVDTEHAFDPEWAADLGVDTASLMVNHPETGEEAVDLTELLVRNQVDLIIWDSVAATYPQDEAKKRMSTENIQPARQAALMSAAMRRLTAANSKTALVFINQTRINVGMMFGNPESVPGGKAIPFYASMRLALRKGQKVKNNIKVWDGDKNVSTKEVVGQKIRATLEKSKLNKPYRDVLFTFDLTEGAVDEDGYLISRGIENGIIFKKGTRWQVSGDSSTTTMADIKQRVSTDATLRAMLLGQQAPVKKTTSPSPSPRGSQRQRNTTASGRRRKR